MAGTARAPGSGRRVVAAEGPKSNLAEKLAETFGILRDNAEQQLGRALARPNGADERAIALRESLLQKALECEERFMAFWHTVIDFSIETRFEQILAMEESFDKLTAAVEEIERLARRVVENGGECAENLAVILRIRDGLSQYGSDLAGIIERDGFAEAKAIALRPIVEGK